MTQNELMRKVKYDPDTGIFTLLSTGRKLGYTDNYKGGYVYFNINKKRYKAHRLAWLYCYGEFPKYVIDHINRIRNDNRISNLRDVPQYINCKNQNLSKRNTSGNSCVYFVKDRNKYRVKITYEKKIHELGYFKNIEDAILIKNQFYKKHNLIP